MKNFKRWPRFSSQRLALFALGGLLVWTLGQADSLSPKPSGFPSPCISGEEATPDCGNFAADLFPARQRARHLAALGVDRWLAAGYRGQGTKIAVLDLGFRGYRSHLGKALPAKITTRSFRADGNLEGKDSQHGILCGEVLHALAPDAELLFANWDAGHPEEFLAATRWARQQGAHILSCSIIMPSWSDGEGGGNVDRTLTSIIGSGKDRDDSLFFASAGNTAQRHWSGAFLGDNEGWHEWCTGHSTNILTPWGSAPVSVEMYWKPGAEYELTVTNLAGKTVGEASKHRGADRSCLVVNFNPDPTASYQVHVRHLRGEAGAFHLVALGGGLCYATASGSIPCPADAESVQAVGAVHEDGSRAIYSSCGPNSSKPKPDFVAPVPFPSLWRDRPFSGTSAAAPQAAALAALIWSRHPDWSANEVREALRSAAHDLGPQGHDCETGHGLIMLPTGDLAQTK